MIKYLEENDNFKEMIKDKKILVDFYADWCGPCKMMGNILEEVDFIDIIKVNVDLFPELSKEYSVMSIPTLICFENGEIKNQSVGFIEMDKIKEMTEWYSLKKIILNIIILGDKMKKIFLILIMFFFLTLNVFADEELLINNLTINNATIEPKFDPYNNYYSVTIQEGVNSLDIDCKYNEEKYNIVISNNENLVQNKLVYMTIYNKETEEKNTYIFKIYTQEIEDTVSKIENEKNEVNIPSNDNDEKIAPTIAAVCLSLIIIIYYLFFLMWHI